METTNEGVLENTDLKAAVISVGQGGYRFGCHLVNQKFGSPERFVAINYKTDLMKCDLVPETNRISINEASFGAGKDRDKSKNDVKQRVSEIIEAVAKILNNYDVLFITYSLDGGTGSGGGPLIEAMLGSPVFPKKKGRQPPIIGIPVFPSRSETDGGLQAKTNLEGALRELNALYARKSITGFLADLNYEFEGNAKLDKTSRYDAVDEYAASLIYRFFCLNYLSKSSNLDFEDRYVVETTPGLHALVTYDSKGWHSPFLLPRGMTVNRVASEIPEGDETIRDKIIKELGVTVVERGFLGFYEAGAASSGAYPIIDFAGFNLPEQIISQVEGEVQELRQKNEAKKQADAAKVADSFMSLDDDKNYIEEENSVKGVSDIDEVIGLIG